MPQNFFALCHGAQGIEIKRIRINSSVQSELVSLFADQEAAFGNDVSEEIVFTGDWKPDDHELLTISDFPEKQALLDAVGSNLTSMSELNLAGFANEPIKAVFTAVQNDGDTKILIQRFTAAQILSRKLTLMMDNNTYKKLEQPAFAMANALTCVIEGGILKFRSFSNVKTIFTLFQYYQEATDGDIDNFFSSTSPLEIADIGVFKNGADQGTRKLIHAIMRRSVLNNHTPEAIHTVAANMNLPLQLVNGKLLLPGTRREMKQVLHFLDDGFYEAPLSQARYITNSKQAV